jgi:TonB family protein
MTTRSARFISPFSALPRLRWLLVASVLAAGVLLSACGGSKNTAEGLEMYVVDSVDTAPQIVGGMQEVHKLTTYPDDAREADAFGTVWVRGVVTVRGRMTRLRIVQGGHRSLERVALEVARQLTFEPARIDKGPVPAEVEIPVTFPPPEVEEEG